jgi:1-acyl-sn-glycerol-3-phosphate acyltransferase
MVIVFVLDNYLSKTDGTNISAHRFRKELIKQGYTVRVVSTGVEGPDMYGLKEHYIPIVTPVARLSNMKFAKFNKKVVSRALEGADLVHLFFPFQVERKTMRLAKKMDIPVCGAFHCQPENITYNMGLKRLSFIASFLYWFFKVRLYGKVENIHCPSSFLAGELKKHKYRARLHVISNGVSPNLSPPKQPAVKRDDGRINILMIGRLAPEKRQDLIIKAVKHSRYRDKIWLYFAGEGAYRKKYAALAEGLPNPPRFEFLPQDRLWELIQKTDIYIHASDAEIEGISCMEAFSAGKVPIISDSKKSATSQFALDERSLFRRGSYLDLRDKLDYWIEHPEEREQMAKEYAKLGKSYNISHSVLKMIQMFNDALKDFKTRKMIREDQEIKKYNSRIQRNNYIKEFFCTFFYFFIAIPLFLIINCCFFGLKIENRKALKKIKKTGAVTICNHVHEMDSAICAVGISSRKLIYVSKPVNFSLGVAGIFVDILGSVPAPSSPKELQSFIYTLSKYLRKGRLVHFYPEGELIKYGSDIRNFQQGAFYLAVDAQLPVLPMKIIYRKPRGVYKLFKKKRPCLTLVFGDPLYPNYYMLKDEAVEDIQKRAETIMHTLAV